MFWSQLHTILWLRWRLTRNQWSRTGRLSVAISMVIGAILLLIGLGGGIGGLLAGVFRAAKFPPAAMLGIYDGLTIAFLFFWMIGILSSIQRSESIDIGKILHLPISLKGVFLVNYLASHVTVSIIVFMPAMLGLAVGLVVGRSWMMIAMVPLILGVLFMTTAWTYLLRGWLVILMRNPRRYRAVVAGITMGFVLLAQLPNLLMHVGVQRESRSLRETHRTPGQSPADGTVRRGNTPLDFPLVLLAHKVVPPLWVGNGAMSLAEGEPLPAILAAAAAFGIGGLGLARAYRSTCRFYEGRTSAEKARPRRKERPAAPVASRLLERRLPGVSDEAAGLAMACFRSLTRATEVKMALASNTLMLILFGGMSLLSHPRDLSFRAQLFYATGIALLPLLGTAYILANQFGFDRAGFRTLVLSPMARSEILLGKNLALLPILVVLAVVYLTLAAFALRLDLVVVSAAFAQSLAAFFLLCIPGNALSSLLPFRVRDGTLAATKIGFAKGLLNVFVHLACMSLLSVLLLPAVAASLMSAAFGVPAGLVYLFFSLAELAVIVTIYGLSLFGLGELLQRREKEILRVVTQEVE